MDRKEIEELIESVYGLKPLKIKREIVGWRCQCEIAGYKMTCFNGNPDMGGGACRAGLHRSYWKEVYADEEEEKGEQWVCRNCDRGPCEGSNDGKYYIYPVNCTYISNKIANWQKKGGKDE